MIASVAGGQLPTGWQSSGTGAKGFTVGYDVSRQSGGRQASGLEERSAYIAANVAEPAGSATLTQAIRSDDYRGRRVRLSGFVRQSPAVGQSAMLFLRLEGNGVVLGTDRRSVMIAGSTKSPDWVQHQIVVDVPENSTGLRFGFLKEGNGEAWLRSVKLEVVDASTPLTGVSMSVALDEGTTGAIAQRVARKEATYRQLSRHPVNMDFMDVDNRTP
jgi:hypothetical protein